jgi:hypothetical protein
MTKFHINPSTGEPGKCSATKGNCPFGGPSHHYGSIEEARGESEKQLANANGWAGTKRNDTSAVDPPVMLPEAERFELLKAKAEKLHRRAHSFAPDGVRQNEWDAETERSVTALGLELSAEVDILLGLPEDYARKQVNSVDRKDVAAVGAELAARYSAAYKTVLSRIRSFDGDSIGLLGDEAQLSLFHRSVAGCYPEAWLKLSNERAKVIPLRVAKEADGGAYVRYDDEPGDAEGSYTAPSGYGSFTELDKKSYEAVMKLLRPHLPEDAVEFTSQNDLPLYSVNYTYSAQESYKKALHGAKVNGRPKGDEWEWGVNLQKVSNYMERNLVTDHAALKIELAPTWIRKQKVATVPEEILSFSEKPMLGEASSNAIHELGHRMEQVVPDRALPRLERAFLLRRSNKSASNEFKRMRIGDDPGFSHNAKMVSNYMARDYFDGQNYEVFTTGMESLMGGTYGGLRGADTDYRKADADHRGFVLGALAAL